MNAGHHIYNLLQEKGIAEIPGFGVFTLEKKPAQYNEEKSAFFPPAQEIIFEHRPGIFSPELSRFIVEKTSENLFEVQNNLRDEVASWKEKLEEEGKLVLEDLGEFFMVNQVVTFKAQKDFTKTPKYFGLETISLQEVFDENVQPEYQYVFNRSLLWSFLFILPVGGILYLAFSRQDELFGKPSKLTVKKAVVKKEMIDTVKVDSAQITKADSLSKAKSLTHEKK